MKYHNQYKLVETKFYYLMYYPKAKSLRHVDLSIKVLNNEILDTRVYVCSSKLCTS